MIKRIIKYTIGRPKIIISLTLLLVVIALGQFSKIKVDTDPENMLSESAPARIFNREMKQEFKLYDLIVVGITNDAHPDGVFNVSSLEKIYNLTAEIKKIPGVIPQEIIAPSTKDNIQQGGIGEVRFNWLMDKPPVSRKEALLIRDEAKDNPMFYGTMVSEDGKMIALYIPIKKKSLSYEISQEIKSITDNYTGQEKFYFAGLPIANDQFGAEMFKQMAISAPLAGLIIFLLMWFFFKSVRLIIAPMIVAVSTVIITMGVLIGFGFPVHIMSSMIPIFLMPIAVLDSVHILSEFFDKYAIYQDRKKTIKFVLDELFSPMLFTSLTSAAGFFSLSFSPIPPVQIFGVLVAFGVIIAWILTILFIPAYIMLMKADNFKRFKTKKNKTGGAIIDKILSRIKTVSLKNSKVIIAITIFLVGLSIYGITKVQVNDNPVRWFSYKHPIRVADRLLNKHLSGTYEAYLVLENKSDESEVFIYPEMLLHVESLQKMMIDSGYVGKTTSLADIVKKIYYELLGGDKINNVIPKSKAAVAQCLLAFENSHKPDDLWHMSTPDYSKLNIWVQLKSGDNKDMDRVIKLVDAFIKNNPLPFSIEHKWAGLTYINVVWQNNMVVGMLKNFIGSFVIVLFMMLFLFRSPVKALISMIPLTVTILFIYSLLGFFQKDYDMPIAVLSALTLGLSVDFAIHFIQRAVELSRSVKSWDEIASEMFSGPGRAIIRNALVVAIGFLPLLAAPLVPYKTVGFFMFMIMAVSSLATLFLIPALISLKPEIIFNKNLDKIGCSYSQCLLVALFVAFAVAYVLLGYTVLDWPVATFISIGVVVFFAGACHFVSKYKQCSVLEVKK